MMECFGVLRERNTKHLRYHICSHVIIGGAKSPIDNHYRCHVTELCQARFEKSRLVTDSDFPTNPHVLLAKGEGYAR